MRSAVGVPPSTSAGYPAKTTIPANDLLAALQAADIVAAGGAYSRAFWVDGNRGVDTNDGRSSSSPYLTMSKAFDNIASGDIIFARGNIREQLNTPAGVFDVTIMGPSPVTRHPDAHTTNGGYSSFRWNAPASPTAATPLLNIRQQGWRIINGLFTGDSTNTVDCIQLFRDAGAGDAERDASHAEIIGCRFQGGRYGVVDSGGCARVHLFGNEFLTFSNSGNRAVTAVTGAGVGTLWGWEIVGNNFHANLTDIQAGFTGARIEENHFHFVSLGTTNVVAITTSGGSRNWVINNHMYAAFNTSGMNARFVLGTNDLYGPNYYSSGYTVGEPTE